jgi:hypothetical protein
MGEITRRNIGSSTGQLETQPHLTDPQHECRGHLSHSFSHLHLYSSVLQVLLLVSFSPRLQCYRMTR